MKRSSPSAFATLVSAAASFGAIACTCDSPPPLEIPDAGQPDAPAPLDGGREFGDSSFSVGSLEVARVVPSHGPFSGGNTAVLRGTGFRGEPNVRFGGRAVQPADHRVIDARRLQVVVPAGEVGPVDVTVEIDGETFTLRNGYTYDAISVDPASGSISGGTFVTVLGSGTSFREGDQVLFGRSPCTNVEIVSETRITCRTPPSAAGTVDVTVARAADGTETVAHSAFTYYDSADTYGGGLGGGPIRGSINVTAIDAMTGLPVPEAFAIVGEDLSTVHQGFTDVMGQITFSGPDLVGPQTVHIAKHCYERTSFVAFDAANVTVFLVPWMDPMCGMGSPSGGGRGRNGSFIEGELIWSGPNEYGPNPWSNIPEPRPGWNRVAYVFTTQQAIDRPNPDPSAGGGTNRILEVIRENSELGYPYRIFARPGGMAVYALAGLENPSRGQFIPYVMGVARNVLAGPGETIRRVNVEMDIPLDHYVELSLGRHPERLRPGPDRYRFEATLDLGGEGVIVRRWSTFDFDVVRRRDTARAIRFVAEPALQGTIADARYRISAGWYTGDFDQYPYTTAVRNGVTATDEVVAMPDFIGIPDAVAPTDGAPLPRDRILRWRATPGGEQADFHLVMMVGGDGNPAWRMIVPGDVFEAPFPNLSSIPGIRDVARGTIYWGVFSAKVPGFEFNEFTYFYLNDRYHSQASFHQFVATF